MPDMEPIPSGAGNPAPRQGREPARAPSRLSHLGEQLDRFGGFRRENRLDFMGPVSRDRVPCRSVPLIRKLPRRRLRSCSCAARSASRTHETAGSGAWWRTAACAASGPFSVRSCIEAISATALGTARCHAIKVLKGRAGPRQVALCPGNRATPALDREAGKIDVAARSVPSRPGRRGRMRRRTGCCWPPSAGLASRPPAPCCAGTIKLQWVHGTSLVMMISWKRMGPCPRNLQAARSTSSVC